MTEARVTQTVASLEEAKGFLAQARRLSNDGQAETISDTGRQLVLYHACLAACDAALIAVGRKVEGAEGGHALRLRETAALLGLDEDLVDALDDARGIRAGSAYRAGVVLRHQVSAASEAAAQLIVEVEQFVSRQASP
jgi:hypothetical protein